MNSANRQDRVIQICHRQQAIERRAWYFRHYEIHALFDELIHRPWGVAQWNPPVDIREDRDGYVIEVDLPGVKTEDVRILAQGNTLVIEGHRELGPCAGEIAVHLCERPSGKFVRTFVFDERIDAGRIESRRQDGVLVVRVPKPQKEQDGDHG